ncbi:sigma-54 dependent transcriptional regulator [Thermithiobacillus tepidarius DSM 3134]|uniref:sigma-54-dependent transcriptional regulator n=1 Tax=Thermithiobacillus tepidarius TaxID=929 RepID=UPI0004290533|nr:sigma-54 dependent transcriptional regulator [Thermithiobacillus tepidarius]
MTRVLLVDDQRSLRRSLSLMLQNAGFETGEAASGAEALALLDAETFDAVITDMRMEGMSGIDLLRAIKTRDETLPVIVITAYASIESAVEAMRLGAFDYLTKPFQEKDIVEKINACTAFRDCVSRQPAKAVPLPQAYVPVSGSPEMRAVLIRVERIAQTDLSVLITGETGTGKSRIARLLHDRSPRAAFPFVSINCASLPEQLLESELFGHVRGSFTGATESRTGLFEAADRGTIFLDEVDTLSPAMQAKLLSVLQDRQVRRVGSNQWKSIDIRVLAASNQNLGALIESGRFREDLYYRIKGVRLHLPPLRERGDDLISLLDSLLQKYAAKYGRTKLRLTERAMSHLVGYSYPGNIRELESFVEQMAVFADENDWIDVDALPEEVLKHSKTSASPHRERSGVLNLALSERLLIESALERFESISEAARELGIGRTTLWRKMRQYGLQAEGGPAAECNTPSDSD